MFVLFVVVGQESWRSSSSLQHHAEEELVAALMNARPVSSTPRPLTPGRSRVSSHRLCFSGNLLSFLVQHQTWVETPDLIGCERKRGCEEYNFILLRMSYWCINLSEKKTLKISFLLTCCVKSCFSSFYASSQAVYQKRPKINILKTECSEKFCKTWNVIFKIFFVRSLLCSPRLHLFEQNAVIL